MKEFSFRGLIVSTSYLASGQFIVLICTFFRTLVVVRALGPDSYGILAIVMATYLFVSELLSFRIQEPLTRYMVEYAETDNNNLVRLLSSVVGAELITKMLSLFTIIIMAPVVVHLTDISSNNTSLFWMLAIGLPINIFGNLWFCLARHYGRYRLLGTVQGGLALVHLLFIIVLYYSPVGLTLQIVIFVIFCDSLFRGVLSFLYTRPMLQAIAGITLKDLTPVKALFEYSRLKGFWSFMASGYVSSSLVSMVRNGDVLILGTLRSTSEVGIYQVARNLANVALQLGASLSVVIYQDFNKYVQERCYDDLRALIKKFTIIAIPIVVSLLLLGIFLSGPFIELAYGEDYRDSADLFVIFLIAVVVVQWLFWAHPLGLSLDCSTAFMKQVMVLTPLSLPLIYILSGYFGAMGTAIGIGLWWLLSRLAILWITMRRLNLYLQTTNS